MHEPRVGEVRTSGCVLGHDGEHAALRVREVRRLTRCDQVSAEAGKDLARGIRNTSFLTSTQRRVGH